MASLARTILEEHLERGDLVPGQEIALRVDQTLAQDATGTMACMQFELFEVDRVQVETAVVYVDHNILQIDFKNPDDHRFLQGMAGRYGLWFSRPGNGICHYVHCERFATPGETLIGAVFPAADETRAWLTEQQREGDFTALEAGDTGDFDEEEHIDLAALVPLVAKPSSPGNVVPVEELVGTELTQVCIGSSVNSSYEDLAVCGAVLRGQELSEKLVSATATPGSRQILDQITRSGTYVDLLMAGVRMLEPACGPCVGMGPAPPSGSHPPRTVHRTFPRRRRTGG